VEREEKTWTCPDCGAQVEPVEFPGFGCIRRRFCNHCEAGRKKEAAAFDKSYLHKAQRNRWIGDAGLDPELTFDNYEGRQSSIALNYAKALLADKRGWLWIHGPYGTHKQHLANAIGMLVLDHSTRDPHVRMLDWRSFVQSMKAEWSENPAHAEYPYRIRQAQKAGLLILNSVGDLPRKAYAVRQFVDLIAQRSRSRESKPTIFVSAIPFESKTSSSLVDLMRGVGSQEIDLLVEEWQAVFDKEINKAEIGGVIYTGRK
jgi:DNA replication protein DnaC